MPKFRKCPCGANMNLIIYGQPLYPTYRFVCSACRRTESFYRTPTALEDEERFFAHFLVMLVVLVAPLFLWFLFIILQNCNEQIKTNRWNVDYFRKEPPISNTIRQGI